VSVTVGGVAVAVPARKLVAGGDYTLAVYGTTAGNAVASWIPDDNRLPTDPTKAKLRLVNTVADKGNLALSIEFAPIAVDVLPGQASGYVEVEPSTTAQIVVASGGTTLFAATDRVISANAVYSLFVAAPPDPAAPVPVVAILRKDR